jgi:hypothetical protein
VYNSALQKQANALVKSYKIKDTSFQERLTANLDDIHSHFRAIYGDSPLFGELINSIFQTGFLYQFEMSGDMNKSVIRKKIIAKIRESANNVL